MDLKQYLQIAYKHRWLLAAGLLVGLGFGFYTNATSQRSYSGGVTFFVSSAGEGTTSAANVGDQFALRRVNSYIALLRTDRLGQMIVDDTGIELTAAQVRSSIRGSADVNTVLLTARVADGDREQALLIAESLSRQFVQLVADLERPAAGESSVRLEVVAGPSVSVVPVRTKLILASRALAGLMVAAVIVLIRELTDNRLHSTDEIAKFSDAPLLGLIGHDRHAAHAPLILSAGMNSARAEAYRQLRTNLQFIDTEDRAQVIVVTSSIAGEGKSTTAANLAITLAESGQRVLVLDADLRNPTIGELFSFEQAVGFTDVLLGRAELDDVLQPWGASHLTVLPSGTQPPNPSELLGTVATRRLVTELRQRFDTVVIDTPPLVPVTDAAVVSTLADGVVLLVRPEKVTTAQFQRALGQLDRVGARLFGFVGSMLPERSTGVYGTYGGDRSDVGVGTLPSPAASPDIHRGARSDSALADALEQAQSRLDDGRRRVRWGPAKPSN